MSQSKTTIVITKKLNEEQAGAMREMLNSPTLIKIVKQNYENTLSEIFDDGESIIESVDFELTE